MFRLLRNELETGKELFLMAFTGATELFQALKNLPCLETGQIINFVAKSVKIKVFQQKTCSTSQHHSYLTFKIFYTPNKSYLNVPNPDFLRPKKHCLNGMIGLVLNASICSRV